MQQHLAIETQQLQYSFGNGYKVVNNLSLQVPKGSIYGFLGPNGAGKTTTMRLLTGLLPNQENNIFLQGKSLQQNMPSIFSDIGTLIEMPSLYLHLNAYNNLKIICTLRGIALTRIEEVLAIVGLQQNAFQKVKTFSLGMKQRLGIAMALLPKPSLLMLDEPVNGLDPAGIIEIRELLKSLNKNEGLTVFISSHLLAEVEKTCTHVAIINKGVLKFEGSLQQLYNQSQQHQVLFNVNNTPKAIGLLNQHQIKSKLVDQYHVEITCESNETIAAINQLLSSHEVQVYGIHKSGTLEDWFMHITSN